MSQSIKANTIIGLPVITIDDGRNVSTAKEIIYDVLSNKVMGIVVDEKGWFQNAKIILIDNINSIGDDAILIPSENAIIEAENNHSSVASSIANNQNFLTKNEVITQSGKKLGRVTDIYFDFPGGQVDAIEVSEGFLQGINSSTKKLNFADIITNGEDNLIVKDSADETLNDQSQDQGLNKFISDTKENIGNLAQNTANMAQKTYETAKTTTVDLAQRFGEQTQEIINSQPAQNAIHQTGELTQNVRHAVGQTSQNAQNLVDNAGDIAMSKTHEIKTAITDQRIANSIGKRIGKVVIVDDQDNILASPDDIITHELIATVKEHGDIEELLNNVV